ncbi:MAG: hypothetical protein M3481_12195 [Actinomycetota bacterium]|nr:hypothetical protein [Actinomycetota bacterium]
MHVLLMLMTLGLADVEVVGIEGPGWPSFTPDLVEHRVEDLLKGARRSQAVRRAPRHDRRQRASARLWAARVATSHDE